MDSKYWQVFWDDFTRNNPNSDLFQQVGRTIEGKGPNPEILTDILTYIHRALDLNTESQLLDLCCGNGLITNQLAPACKSVMAVDFSEFLIQNLLKDSHDNTNAIQSNILDLEIEANSFDRILMTAALQHFSETEIVSLFQKIKVWLKPSGILLITDIIDQNRKWKFYNSKEREGIYFDHLKNGKPILGTWIDPTWLTKLGLYVDFKEIKIVDQPKHFPFAHYRFDFIAIA